ncbi:MAG: hypothetical protein WD060_06375 [Pirellulales bacterium]
MLHAQTHRQHTLTIGLPIMAAALALLIAAAPHSARAQAPADLDPPGGLRDDVDSGSTTVGMSREELVRKWDLDGNGAIDESEAAVARTRMRRSRLEMQRSAAIDPLTGRPRVTDAADEPSVTADIPPQPRRRPPAGPSLPGTRVPDVPLAAPARTTSSSAPPANASKVGPAAAGSTPTRTGGAMGGVRAGAPAARPGYGSLTTGGDPKAGRSPGKTGSLRAPTTAAAVPDGRGAAFRGGLLPAPRLGRTSQPRGPLSAPSGRPESPTPRTPLMPRTPRLNADEIGGF